MFKDKLFQGALTAEEVWRMHQKQRGETCPICGSHKLAIRIRVFVDIEDLKTRAVELYHLMLARGAGQIPFTPMKWGKGGVQHQMVRVTDKGFCDNCAKQAEIEAAKGPSWAFIEIDRGPGKDKTVVQVPSAIVKPDGTSAGSTS